MKNLLNALLLSGVFVSFASFAAPPADAPAGTMGLCKDGSYSSAAAKKGACKGHKGVKEWYGDAAAPAAPAAKPAAAAAAAPAAAAAAPAAAAAMAPKPAAAAPATAAPAKMAAGAKTPAPGGGPGMVWVNSSTKKYHCEGTKYYGTTKAGQYMSEADATAAGNKPAGGKTCGK